MTTITMYPNDSARTRRSDPVTSHEAADSNDTAGSRAEVLRLLTTLGPLADHELVAAHDFNDTAHYTPQRLRTARHELTENGLVVETGYYHLTNTRRRAKVWELR